MTVFELISYSRFNTQLCPWTAPGSSRKAVRRYRKGGAGKERRGRARNSVPRLDHTESNHRGRSAKRRDCPGSRRQEYRLQRQAFVERTVAEENRQLLPLRRLADNAFLRRSRRLDGVRTIDSDLTRSGMRQFTLELTCINKKMCFLIRLNASKPCRPTTDTSWRTTTVTSSRSTAALWSSWKATWRTAAPSSTSQPRCCCFRWCWPPSPKLSLPIHKSVRCWSRVLPY